MILLTANDRASKAYFSDAKVVDSVDAAIDAINNRYLELNPSALQNGQIVAVPNGKPVDVIINGHGNYARDDQGQPVPLTSFDIGNDTLGVGTPATQRFAQALRGKIRNLTLAVCGTGTDNQRLLIELAEGLATRKVA